jgi:hypothetical protein
MASIERTCFFCDMQADKALLWAGNSKRLYICNPHIDDGLSQIMDINNDAVNKIVDLYPASPNTPEEEEEYKVDYEQALNININVGK